MATAVVSGHDYLDFWKKRAGRRQSVLAPNSPWDVITKPAYLVFGAARSLCRH